VFPENLILIAVTTMADVHHVSVDQIMRDSKIMCDSKLFACNVPLFSAEAPFSLLARNGLLRAGEVKSQLHLLCCVIQALLCPVDLLR